MCSTEPVSFITAVANVLVGACSLPRYPPPYPVEEYILRYASRLDPPRCLMVPVGQLAVKVDSEGCETT